MPITEIHIPDITQNVHRPIVLGVIKDLTKAGHLPKAKLRYHEVVKMAKVAERDNAGQIKDPNPHRAKLLGDDILLAEVTREPLDYPGWGYKTKYHESSPLLEIPGKGFCVTCAYETITYNVNFVFQSPSRNKCIEIANTIRNLIYVGKDARLHDGEFSLSLPNTIMTMTKLMYAYQEKVKPYNRTIDDFFNAIANHTMVQVTDIVSKNTQLRWTVSQLQIEGYFTEPDIQLEDNEDGSYRIEIPYRILANEPLFYKLDYPISMHNQLLPAKVLLRSDPLKDTVNTSHLVSAYKVGLDNTQLLIPEAHTKYPVKVPPIDPITIEHNIKGYIPVVQALTLIGDDERSIVDLDELGSTLVYPKMKEFLHAQGKDEIFNIYRGIFFLQLYKNGKIAEDPRGYLSIDDDLLVKAKDKLDLRDVHHIVLQVAYDLNPLYDKAWVLLADNPELLKSIIAIAYRKGLVEKLVYDAIVGVVHPDTQEVIKGITTFRGLRFLYKILRDADESKLVLRKRSYEKGKDILDSIYTLDSVSEATGMANTLIARTVSVSTVEARGFGDDKPVNIPEVSAVKDETPVTPPPVDTTPPPVDTTPPPEDNNPPPVDTTPPPVNTVPPTITLNNTAPIILKKGSQFTDPGAVAIDAKGNTLNVLVSGTVDTSTPGTYTITYTVTDNGTPPLTTTLTRDIVITAPVKPVITLNGGDIVLHVANNKPLIVPVQGSDTVIVDITNNKPLIVPVQGSDTVIVDKENSTPSIILVGGNDTNILSI